MAEMTAVNMNPNTEPKSDKKAKKPSTVKYIVLADCIFKKVWRKKGDIIELPADEKVTHAAVVPFTSETQLRKRPPAERGKDPYLDLLGDAVKRSSLDKAFEGIPGIRR